jgi:ABC-type microcin C transport system duplicated ATPase subunit YejF
MSDPILRIENLSLSYLVGDTKFRALKSVSMSVPRGSVVALVGESGSGKTTLIRSIMRVLPKQAVIEEGKIYFEGKDLLSLNEEDMLKIRGKKISMVFQDPISHLNPVMSVKEQLIESIELHRGLKEKRRRMKLLGYCP